MCLSLALRSTLIVVLLIYLGVSPICCGRFFLIRGRGRWQMVSVCLGADCGVGHVCVAVMYVYSFVYVFVVVSALHIDRRSSHLLGCVSDMLWPFFPDPRAWALAVGKYFFAG